MEIVQNPLFFKQWDSLAQPARNSMQIVDELGAPVYENSLRLFACSAAAAKGGLPCCHFQDAVSVCEPHCTQASCRCGILSDTCHQASLWNVHSKIEIIGSPATVVGLIPMRGAGIRMSLFFVFPFSTSLASTTSTLEILDLSLQVLDLTLQPFFVVTGSCLQLLHIVGILITRLMLPYCSGCRQRRTSGATMACCKDVFIG